MIKIVYFPRNSLLVDVSCCIIHELSRKSGEKGCTVISSDIFLGILYYMYYVILGYCITYIIYFK